MLRELGGKKYKWKPVADRKLCLASLNVVELGIALGLGEKIPLVLFHNYFIAVFPLLKPKIKAYLFIIHVSRVRIQIIGISQY